MVKVSQKFSLTVNLGEYNSEKVEIGIDDLDLEADVDDQIARIIEALKKTTPILGKKLFEDAAAVQKRFHKSQEGV